SGALAGDALAWGPEADVILTGTVVVAAGDTLDIAAGTRVLAADRVSVEVSGTVKAHGDADAPILFTASGEAWGGLRLLPGAVGELDETWLVAGGGDPALSFGHSGSQPVVWVAAAQLTMRGGGVLDSPGKAFGAQDADLTLEDVRVARCDTGGELERTHLVADRLHVSEIPDADGVVEDDDNDGIYLRDAKLVAGEAVESVLRDCVFAVGEDDGIDHNEALVRVERTWIEGFYHEGVAASNGRRITVVDSVVRGCEQGIEAGYGAPEVRVDGSIVTGNGAGLRFGDSYDWDDEGTLDATGCVVYGNDVDVRNFARGLGGPKPDAVMVSCSVVGDPAWVGVAGNVAGPPEGPWAAGCPTGPALDAAACPGVALGPACPTATR
ncbi:MAG: right-handed parallel beta-helix repeat-containing protein, partial [Deltaproteobacteria bacterium]